jgi:hypothetical protein
MYAGLGAHIQAANAAAAGPKRETTPTPEGGAGLGAAAAAGGQAEGDNEGPKPPGAQTLESMYSQYRSMRSGGYHAMIMRWVRGLPVVTCPLAMVQADLGQGGVQMLGLGYVRVLTVVADCCYM